MKGIENKITKYIKGRNVLAGYLFGSQAEGRRTGLSDIDIAVLLPENIPRDNYFDLRLQMTLDLMEILHENDIDVIILNETPPLLKYQVIVKGKVLYCRDELARNSFEVRAILEYLDFKPILDLQFDYLKRRLKEGKFGVRYQHN